MVEKISIGPKMSPYVIAEIGSNFNQSFDTACRLIDEAAKAKANAVKFQLFRAESLYPSRKGLYDVFKSIELNPEWVPKLFEYAKNSGLAFCASAFDFESVAILESIGVPFHKIASSETVNLGFVHRIASAGKPVLISSGMCDLDDIETAVEVCLDLGNNKIIIMQCSAIYPLPPECAHLRVLQTFKSRFGGVVGFSDHTMGFAVATAAIGLGATIFEKHLTLDRNSSGPDHRHATEPKELYTYVQALHEAYAALGSSEKKILVDERGGRRRESLYSARKLSVGERLKADDIVIKGPVVGLKPKFYKTLIGSIIKKTINKDQPLTWDLVGFDK